MKKLIIVFIAALFFGACNHSDQEVIPRQPVDVAFNVSVFTTEITDFENTKTKSKLKSDDNSSGIGFLYYIVFQNGKKIKHIIKKKEDKDFTKIKDQLYPGDYIILFVGTKDDPKDQFSGIEKLSDFKMKNTTNDVFIHEERIKISGDIKPEEQKISLKRCVGKIIFKLTGVPDPEVSEIKLESKNFPGVFSFGGKQIEDLILDKTFPETTKTIEIYGFNINSKQTLDFKFATLDKEGKIIAEKTFQISFYGNQIVTATGNIFLKQNSFIIDVEDDWKGDTTVEF